MKAVVDGDRLLRALARTRPPRRIPSTSGWPASTPSTARCWRRSSTEFVARRTLDVYYEDAIEELAARAPVGLISVDGLAWVEIDDHDDLARARERDPRAGRVKAGGARSPPTGTRALSVWRRYMELPRYLRAVRGHAELVATLERARRRARLRAARDRQRRDLHARRSRRRSRASSASRPAQWSRSRERRGRRRGACRRRRARTGGCARGGWWRQDDRRRQVGL